MNRTNLDIRLKAMESDVPMWRIAEEIGITASSLSTRMRHELQQEEKNTIYAAIESITEKRMGIRA